MAANLDVLLISTSQEVQHKASLAIMREKQFTPKLTIATSLGDGFGRALATQPKAIVIDSDALVPNGWNVVDFVRLCTEHTATSHMKIIMVDATVPSSLIKDATRAGLAHYVPRDFKPSQLYFRIVHLLNPGANEQLLRAKNNCFDAFFSYNSQQQEAVNAIANDLLLRGIRPWMDGKDLLPGSDWQRAIEDQMVQIPCAAVFIGPETELGPWQREEIHGLLQIAAKNDRRIIPVLLKGKTNIDRIPLFLRSRTFVDFNKLDPDPYDHLCEGIAHATSVIH